jgi:hypothetical protein
MAQPTTLAAILPLAGKFLGKNPKIAREDCVRAINNVRNAWWKVEALRQVLFRWNDCLCVQPFLDNCNGSCARRYLGVSLPHGVTSVDYLEWNGDQVHVTQSSGHSRGDQFGRAAFPGRSFSPAYTLAMSMKAEMLSQDFPLLNEIPASYQGTLVIKCHVPADNGKKAGIRYVTHNGRIMREDVELNVSGYETEYSPQQVLEITFPPRCGYVEVLTTDGYSLGAYHPAIGSPKHRRIRLMGFAGCMGGSVLSCEGLMEPIKVMFDTDRVETDSEPDWQNGMMALDLHFKTGKTSSEMATLAQATSFATGSADAELRAKENTPVASLKPRTLRNVLRKVSFIERRRWP